MDFLETIVQYYQSTNRVVPEDLIKSGGKSEHFNVLRRYNSLRSLPFHRRDYYKVCLSTGGTVFCTDEGRIVVDQPIICFTDPDIKMSFDMYKEEQDGYLSIFNELYLTPDLKREFKKVQTVLGDQLFPFLLLTDEEYKTLYTYFQLMEEEYQSTLPYKKELMQSFLRLIFNAVIRFQKSRVISDEKSERPDRLVSGFLQLLNNQFPIDAPDTVVRLRNPGDFAELLHVHVNHLNHTLRKLTGKSTSVIIQERILEEAKDLLKNSDWNISEIANSLGFEYVQHFSQFFKKYTQNSPGEYRKCFSIRI
ncbi:helix-turn-helix domain-containing protein [Elizabethkingia ursingii]|uniref:helix-turn-helix domain-containing protein n=1 Tax=Elizabethkingia ursingii TaxID=1756150 RepID=UPI002012BB8B|nr:AraC family transcriptional regulator [Elizabethkingia ursingii]MCL1670715.1 helix-turn-helix transcriptional regulator [Elizabethkingia ursingii]